MVVVAGLVGGQRGADRRTGKGDAGPARARAGRGRHVARCGPRARSSRKTQVKVSADIMGKIVRLAVKEGDRVQARPAHAPARRHPVPRRRTRRPARRWRRREARLREAERRQGRGVELTSGRRRCSSRSCCRRRSGTRRPTPTSRAHRARRPRARRWRAPRRRSRARATTSRRRRFVAPIDGVVSALNVEAGRDRDHRHHEQPRHPDPRRSRTCRGCWCGPTSTRPTSSTCTVGQKAQDHGGRAARHLVRGHRDRDRQHREALDSTVGGRGPDQLRGQGGVRPGRARRCGPGMTADVEIETATHAKTTGGADPGGRRAHRARARARRARRARREGETPKRGDANAAEDDTAGKKDKEITGRVRGAATASRSSSRCAPASRARR